MPTRHLCEPGVCRDADRRRVCGPNLNYAESGGNAHRQFFAQAGTREHSRLGRTNEEPLQRAADGDQPAVQGRAAAQGRLHLEQGDERDRRGRLGDDVWRQPSQMQRNYALAGYDRTHIFQMGFVYELPFAKDDADGWWRAVIKNWQINGIFSAFSGTPFTIAGDNTALSQRQGQQTIDQIAEPRASGDAGPDEPYYDPAAFAQPGNKWGNTGRNFLRGPGQWNLDLSLFKAIPFGRYRVEFRAQAQQRAEPLAMGQPGDRLYRRELHAGPQQSTGPPDTDGRALPVLTLVG